MLAHLIRPRPTHRWTVAVLAAIAVLCGDPYPGTAQRPLAAGDIVRYYVPTGERVKARVDAIADGGLRVTVLDRSRLGVVGTPPSEGWTGLERLEGTRRNGGKGALWGAGIGAVFGIASGFGISEEALDGSGGPELALIYGLGGAAVFGGIGLVLGGLSSSEVWAPTTIPQDGMLTPRQRPPWEFTPLLGASGALGVGVRVPVGR